MATALACGAESFNQLTDAEKKAGWRLLFDGKTFKNWIDPAKHTPPGDSWAIEDGCLKARPNPRITEDLFSKETFGDFELTWEWKIAPGGNSGIKYRIQDTVFLDTAKLKAITPKFEEQMGYELQHHISDRARLAPDARAQNYVVGFEYQMIDNSTNKDAQRGGKYQTGALYDMIPPSESAAKAPGEWNSSRLLVRGEHVEHWLNGTKVVDSDLTSEAVKASSQKRWGPAPKLMQMLIDHPRKQCPISLQNHGDDAWFRSIKIRKLT